MSNPLLDVTLASHGAYPFDLIRPEHFIPALNEAIEKAKKKLEDYKKNSRENFQHVIVEKGDITEQVDFIAGIFFNLHSAECSEELEKISPEISEILTRFGNDISLDPTIFLKIKQINYFLCKKFLIIINKLSCVFRQIPHLQLLRKSMRWIAFYRLFK